MLQSKLFTKTHREPPKDETAVNAQLLERAGFAFKNSAGVYSYLPLGWRVMGKIARIIREEMDAIGGQEMFMPALVEKKYMEATDRWNIDVGLRVHQMDGKEMNFTLGWTHEEVLTAIAAKYISSYKDLPFSAYQIQTKFRNEPRAKSGLLRGREFMMKDLYSFHTDEADLMRFYDEVKEAYFRVYKRCGLDAVYTVAAGGAFTAEHTHEFQVLADVGEDTIYYCSACGYAENAEVSKAKEGAPCAKCQSPVSARRAIEVGNIFPLGTKYAKAVGLAYRDQSGTSRDVVMGSYGIGLGRVMATVVEVSHDESGIIWPEGIAPFSVHLIQLSGGETEAAALYESLQKLGIEVLYDDRDASAGEKLMDADLLGIPQRIIVSARTLKSLSCELKARNEKTPSLVKLSDLERTLKQKGIGAI